MKKRYDEITFSGWKPEKVQFGCLAMLAAVEFLMITVFVVDPWIFTFPVEVFCVVPALVFVGVSLTTTVSMSAIRQLLLGCAMVVGLALAQWLQYLKVEKPENISMWWAAYLLAFPFAAVMRDRAQKGLNMVAMAAAAASIMSALYAVMLILGILPGVLSRTIMWDVAGRLKTLQHPVVSGWMFMMGVAFCVGYFFQTKNKLHRWLLALAIALQLVMQWLTNGRAPATMTCAIVAGTIFFSIYRGGWKRFALGLLAAGIVFGTLFALSDFIFDKNHDRLTAQALSQQTLSQQTLSQQTLSQQTLSQQTLSQQAAEPAAECDADQTTSAPQAKVPRTRNDFFQDLKSFTGRSAIWRCVFKSLREHPQYLLWGTSQISGALSALGDPVMTAHTHNAWLQMLLGFGIPGLLLSLVFTFLAARGAVVILFSSRTDMWQKVIAMLVGAMLIAGILEPFLFTAYYSNHFFTVVFMLCVGYLDEWRLRLKYGD